MCVSVLHVQVGMYVHHMYAWCLWRLKGNLIPRTGIVDGCEPPCGCRKLNLSSLHEQSLSHLSSLFASHHLHLSLLLKSILYFPSF